MVDYSKLKEITSKWPQCVVVGKKVSVDQAKAILRRTDDFFVSSFCGGNDEMFALFSGPSESLKNEVKSVVKKCDYSYFRESCPYEHIFRIEEALEYFNQD